MVAESEKDDNESELVSSFQILHLVSSALDLILNGAEPSAISSAIGKIEARFEKSETVLDGLPGGGMTRTEQVEEIERLRRGLETKRGLVDKYAKHDVLSRVLAQRAIPEKPDEVDEDMTGDMMMKMDGGSFAGVGVSGEEHHLAGLSKDGADDVLMGLEI